MCTLIVCLSSCDVKLFCCAHANHTTMTLKKVFSWKPDKFTIIPGISSSVETWKNAVSIFFGVNWHFKQEKSAFYKTRTDYAYKAHVQHFATVKNFSFNQCHKQRVLLYSWDSYFIKAILRQVKARLKRLKRPPTENAKSFFNDGFPKDMIRYISLK